jgi:hypothetical protein
MWLTKRIVYLLIILLGIFFSTKKYRSLSKNMRLLTILIIVTFLAEASAIVCAYVMRKNSFIYMGFGFVQVVLITCVYFYTHQNFLQKRIVLIGGSLTLLILIFTSIVNKAWLHVNSEGSAFKSVYIVFLCLLLLTEWLRNPTTDNILKEPMFWANAGLFFFFSINIFFWMGYNYFEKNDIEILRRLEPIQYSSNLVLYLCIATSFFIFRKIPDDNIENGK